MTYWLMAGGLPLTEAVNPPRIDAFFIWSNTHSGMMPKRKKKRQTATGWTEQWENGIIQTKQYTRLFQISESSQHMTTIQWIFTIYFIIMRIQWKTFIWFYSSKISFWKYCERLISTVIKCCNTNSESPHITETLWGNKPCPPVFLSYGNQPILWTKIS